MEKESIIDFFKREEPGLLKKLKELLNDETNFQIIKFLYQEQKGLPDLRTVIVEKNGKKDALAYQPTPINLEKLTLTYISKKLKIEKDDLKKRLKQFITCGVVASYFARNIDESRYALTSIGTDYFREVYLHVLS